MGTHENNTMRRKSPHRSSDIPEGRASAPESMATMTFPVQLPAGETTFTRGSAVAGQATQKSPSEDNDFILPVVAYGTRCRGRDLLGDLVGKVVNKCNDSHFFM